MSIRLLSPGAGPDEVASFVHRLNGGAGLGPEDEAMAMAAWDRLDQKTRDEIMRTVSPCPDMCAYMCACLRQPEHRPAVTGAAP